MVVPTRRRRLGVIAGGASVAVLLSAGAASAVVPTGVASANPKSPGSSPPNILSPELSEVALVQGSHQLENPSGVVKYYGYLDDGPMVPAPGTNVEATKTEPDKNTYLVLAGQTGADPAYPYGTHFLFQGHEGGAQGYITRVNLDADGKHKVTLMATTDQDGLALPTFDGSTWDPFAQRLLFTAERGNAGGVWQATATFPSTVQDVSGALGRGGYEGIQNDRLGNVYVVEDVGGAKGALNTHAKQPNSYVYKFVPTNPADLTAGGKLQVLQLVSLNTRTPIVFGAGTADDDILSQDVADLHTYGNTFSSKWVTIHDTATAGMVPFDANLLAKPVGTPFKRPENGVFRPGTDFTDFYFTETGDTDLSTEAGAQYGGFGAVFRLVQDAPDADFGIVSMFYRGDPEHTGLDNIQFETGTKLVVVEDAGDTLHTQRNALDSGYLLNTRASYATGTLPVRFLAEGRDASATIDSGLAGSAGFHNDGDNEITGFQVSDGDASTAGVLGAKVPTSSFTRKVWRTFWTQQHGDNVTYQIFPKLR